MAKRLTDTEKFKKKWIRELPCEYKLFWVYLLDDCNLAGIWEVDVEVANLRLGTELKEQEIIKMFGDRIQALDHGAKWYIPSFVEFQYGELNPNNRVHNSVISVLKKQGVYKALISPLQGAKDKAKDKDKDKETKKRLLEFVLLTDEQINRLQSLLGKVTYHEYTQKLNDYIGSKGKSYKSHYHTILTWARKDGKIDLLKDEAKKPDLNCTSCNGKGYLMAQFNGKRTPCSCLY